MVLSGAEHHALAPEITWFAPRPTLDRVSIPPPLLLYEML